MLLIRKQGHGRPVMITAGAHANEPFRRERRRWPWHGIGLLISRW